MYQVDWYLIPVGWFLGHHLAQDRDHGIADIRSEQPWVFRHLGAVH